MEGAAVEKQRALLPQDVDKEDRIAHLAVD
jgi:hypothetical protein